MLLQWIDKHEMTHCFAIAFFEHQMFGFMYIYHNILVLTCSPRHQTKTDKNRWSMLTCRSQYQRSPHGVTLNSLKNHMRPDSFVCILMPQGDKYFPFFLKIVGLNTTQTSLTPNHINIHRFWLLKKNLTQVIFFCWMLNPNCLLFCFVFCFNCCTTQLHSVWILDQIKCPLRAIEAVGKDRLFPGCTRGQKPTGRSCR